MATDGQCAGDYQFKSPFLLGGSCEAISTTIGIQKLMINQDINLSKDYCGMAYTGLSCEDIYKKYPEIVGKSGYYHINDSRQWTYCDMTEKATTPTSPH